MIYFIRSGEFVKIGKANDPQVRLATLQAGHPVPLTLITTIPGSVKVEKALHTRFKSRRQAGEWFLLTDDEVWEAADEFRVMEAASLEEALGRSNWLSILTYDVVKYVAAGGVVVIEWTDDGLTMRLPDVAPDDVHSKFLRLTEASAAPTEATP